MRNTNANEAAISGALSPTLLSPPDSRTPPTASHKRHSDALAMPGRRTSADAIDADALSKALEKFEDAGRHREHTPGESPRRKRQRVYGDRFIPNRSGQDLQASFSLLHDDGSPATPSRSAKRTSHSELNFQKTEEANRTYSQLLRSEMFEGSVPQNFSARSHTPPTTSSLPASSHTPSTPHKNLFSYKSPHHMNISGHPTPNRTPQSRRGPNLDVNSEIYSLSPIKHGSQTMLLSPRKTPRAVSKVPYKVLDAPDLADDFYLNLVDWG
ncbi:hypothetical protein LTS18_015133, partial [Coniosporium uncinatum]